jgi:hypothetical protein
MANTREYSGKDVQVSMLGRPVALRSIKYKASQEKQNVYVLGQKDPYTKMVGRKETEGEVVMLQSEFEALVRSLPAGNDPLDIAPFDIVVLYVDENTGFIITDVLKDVEFTEYEKEINEDDDMMEITLPLNIGRVLLNVG